MVVLIVLTGFCSLAVDVGRVQLARSELRLAVDSAARHAGHGMVGSGVTAARANAAAAAADNKVAGHTLVLDQNADVEFGTWDAATKTFTRAAAGSEASAKAIRVTGHLTAARGNAVQLVFARVLGKQSFEMTARAISRISTRKPGLIGLSFISMSGNVGLGNVSNSYRSKDGTYTALSPTFNRGTIASNGSITLSGNSRVNGDAVPGPGKSVTVSGGASVSGSTSPAASLMSYPMESAGSAATTNNNSAIPSAYLDGDRDFYLSAALTLPGGVYYVNDFEVSAVGLLTFSGPATLYVSGSAYVRGTVKTFADTPSNLRIVMTNSGPFEMSSSGTLYADLYCPASAFKMGGTATFCGSVIAQSVSMGGNASIIFDESLTVTSPLVTMVQ